MDSDFFGFAAKMASFWGGYFLTVFLTEASASSPFSCALIKSADAALWPV